MYNFFFRLFKNYNFKPKGDIKSAKVTSHVIKMQNEMTRPLPRTRRRFPINAIRREGTCPYWLGRNPSRAKVLYPGWEGYNSGKVIALLLTNESIILCKIPT